MFSVTWLGFFATFGRLPPKLDVDAPTPAVQEEQFAPSHRANCDDMIIQSSSEFSWPRCGDG